MSGPASALHCAAVRTHGPDPRDAARTVGGPDSTLRRHRRIRLLVGRVAVWALAAYLLIPWIAKIYRRSQGAFTPIKRVSITADGYPGDPVNIAVDSVLRRPDETKDGRPVHFGSATFDERVGLRHATGQVTHHIGPDVEAERDRIAAEPTGAGRALSECEVCGFHKQRSGRDGGDDPWHTDGRPGVVVLRAAVAAAKGSSSGQ